MSLFSQLKILISPKGLHSGVYTLIPFIGLVYRLFLRTNPRRNSLVVSLGSEQEQTALGELHIGFYVFDFRHRLRESGSLHDGDLIGLLT
jgi:hypothetical protein